VQYLHLTAYDIDVYVGLGEQSEQSSFCSSSPCDYLRIQWCWIHSLLT